MISFFIGPLPPNKITNINSKRHSFHCTHVFSFLNSLMLRSIQGFHIDRWTVGLKTSAQRAVGATKEMSNGAWMSWFCEKMFAWYGNSYWIYLNTTWNFKILICYMLLKAKFLQSYAYPAIVCIYSFFSTCGCSWSIRLELWYPKPLITPWISVAIFGGWKCISSPRSVGPKQVQAGWEQWVHLKKGTLE